MKKIIVTVVLVAIGTFLWWAFSPLLFDVEVNDTLEFTDATPSTPVADVDTVIEPIIETSIPIDEPRTVTADAVSITGTPGHGASGEIKIIHAPNETIVRYENYDGTNGPDLRVYLATDLDATEFIDLGKAKGNKGNINYPIPSNTDIDNFQYVLTWCEAFGVLFDYAKIN